MRRIFTMVARLVAVVVVLGASAGRAQAITLQEIMELTRAGLADDVLLALIEIDERVFSIDPETLKTLKDAGVSPRVIVAIVKSGRTPQSPPDPVLPDPVFPELPDPPAPQVVIVERPVIHEVPVVVAVPVYVPVGRQSHPRHRDDADVEPRKRAEPVYWGWGGKLRPDAWQPK